MILGVHSRRYVTRSKGKPVHMKSVLNKRFFYFITAAVKTSREANFSSPVHISTEKDQKDYRRMWYRIGTATQWPAPTTGPWRSPTKKGEGFHDSPVCKSDYTARVTQDTEISPPGQDRECRNPEFKSKYALCRFSLLILFFIKESLFLHFQMTFTELSVVL